MEKQLNCVINVKERMMSKSQELVNGIKANRTRINAPNGKYDICVSFEDSEGTWIDRPYISKDKLEDVLNAIYLILSQSDLNRGDVFIVGRNRADYILNVKSKIWHTYRDLRLEFRLSTIKNYK